MTPLKQILGRVRTEVFKTIMDVLFFCFFLISGVFLFVFSNSKSYFQKTASESGEEVATKTFKIMKFGSYFLILSAVIYLIVWVL